MMIRLTESWTTLLNKFHSDPYGQIKDKRIENWKKLISNLPQINSTKVDLVDEITVQGNGIIKTKKGQKKTYYILFLGEKALSQFKTYSLILSGSQI